jgi:DNA-3-methyladenine glycosylase
VSADGFCRLPREFFTRDTVEVAQDLLGRMLVRVLPGGDLLAGRIVETEAYREGDQAAHCYRGKTARNAPMYAPGGIAYVYFVYGMHYCFNVVTEAEGTGAAVLIRALEPRVGLATMRARRGPRISDRDLCRGPARLAQAFGIGRELSGYDMLQPDPVLYIADAHAVNADEVMASARIGVSGDVWARARLWRFYERGSRWISG